MPTSNAYKINYNGSVSSWGSPSFTFIFLTFLFSSGLSPLLSHRSLFLFWLWAVKPQDVQLMIIVMIKQHCVMCVVALMTMVKFSGVEFKLMVMQKDQNGNISIIMTLMNSGRQLANAG